MVMSGSGATCSAGYHEFKSHLMGLINTWGVHGDGHTGSCSSGYREFKSRVAFDELWFSPKITLAHVMLIGT